LPLAPNHQLLLAAKTRERDLEEGTPDHPGEPLETAEVNGSATEPASGKAGVARTLHSAGSGQAPPATVGSDGQVVQAAMRQSDPAPTASNQPVPAVNAGSDDRADRAAQMKTPTTGTVVLDIEQGGIEVPSFVGKTVRGAVESAQDAGLELEAVGSGVARQQSPLAGSRVAAGAHVTVQFGR
jgi:cell division protein FtsI (penicillin-binding protein 3)